MRLINPAWYILPQEEGLEGVFKQIEVAGRTCYKSEDKITSDSAKGFVERMIKSGHGAMLEHGTVYLKVPINIDVAATYLDEVETWTKCKLVRVPEDTGGVHYGMGSNWWAITTNYRVIVENNLFDDLQYLCEPTEYHEKRVSVRFICDRGVSHEYVRHRVDSFAQESTRYCDYIAAKFGGEITFITPPWLKPEEEREFIEDLQIYEAIYQKWRNKGWQPQQARGFLPHFVKTELVMTGFVSDWKHFFSLRDADPAHPQARELAKPLHIAFQDRKLL